MRTPIYELPQEFHDEVFYEWLTQARYGSRADLGRILECFRQYMLLVAESELGTTLLPKIGASDVVQESMMEAQKNLDQFNGRSKEEMKSWICNILINNIKDLCRQYRTAKKRAVANEVPFDPFGNADNSYSADTDSPEDKAQEEEDTQQLIAAIARIPIEHQKVITLRYHDDRSWEEIGAAIGKSAEAARKVFGRAIDRLRVEMNVYEPTTIK